MAGLHKPEGASTSGFGYDSIVTKLTQLLQFTKHTSPSKSPVDSQESLDVAKLAHNLVEEISNHLQEQDKRMAELESLATTDALTKVLNRRGFEQILLHELSVARRHGVGGVLIFVDLDEFKPINDTYGHAAGDQVLKTVSILLIGHVRDTDYVGRLGGDEFAVLLPRSNKTNGAKRAQELDRKLNNAHAEWNGKKIPIQASCGMHMYASKDEVRELLESADAAMYRIKQKRKNKLGIDSR